MIVSFLLLFIVYSWPILSRFEISMYQTNSMTYFDASIFQIFDLKFDLHSDISCISLFSFTAQLLFDVWLIDLSKSLQFVSPFQWNLKLYFQTKKWLCRQSFFMSAIFQELRILWMIFSKFIFKYFTDRALCICHRLININDHNCQRI